MEKGWVRFFSWGTGEAGEEQTLYFTSALNLFTSAASFSGQIPGKETIVALEPAKGWQIAYSDVQRLYAEVPQWNNYIRKIILDANRDVELIAQELRNMTAADRYADLMEKQPGLFQVARLKELASYLGITPESLSRIRKRYGENLS